MKIGQSAGKTFAYILGVYMGDGCVTTNQGYPVFRLNAIDKDFVDATQAALKELTDRSVWVCQVQPKGGSLQYQLGCMDPQICQMLVHLTSGKRHLPMGWENWTDEEKRAFAVGLMDSEGYVAEKTVNKTGRAYYMGFKACGEWVRPFVSLLQSIGLLVGKVSDCPPLKEGYKTPTRFHIKMQSWVDAEMRMNIARKQARVDRWKATEPYSERSRYPRKVTSETARQAA